jgi:hypothetical protein
MCVLNVQCVSFVDQHNYFLFSFPSSGRLRSK